MYLLSSQLDKEIYKHHKFQYYVIYFEFFSFFVSQFCY